MKQLTLILVLILSMMGVVHASSQDEEDELAAIAVGMTLEGYRDSEAYKRKKVQENKSIRCKELRSDLEDRVVRRDASKADLERRSDQLSEFLSNLNSRIQLNNATTTDYGGATTYLRNELKKDAAEYKARTDKWKKDRDVHNRKNYELARDVDDFNRECAQP